MEVTLPVATNINAENADGTQYGCTVNGSYESGFTEQSDGRAGRIYQAIQKAITEGAVVEPYVEPVESYADKRRKEYPKIGDQLDAIWKQLNQDRLNGKDLIAEADDLLGSILAVKAKYPKE
jgi:hypothetical protein